MRCGRAVEGGRREPASEPVIKMIARPGGAERPARAGPVGTGPVRPPCGPVARQVQRPVANEGIKVNGVHRVARLVPSAQKRAKVAVEKGRLQQN